MILPTGGVQSDSGEGRGRLVTFELEGEKVKVRTGRGAGDDATWCALGKNGY